MEEKNDHFQRKEEKADHYQSEEIQMLNQELVSLKDLVLPTIMITSALILNQLRS